MNTFQAIVLGLIQGLTEFLPVSSSGHLAIFENILNVDENNVLFFAAMLHMGTLASVFVMYWKDIVELVKEFFATLKDLGQTKSLQINKNPTRRLGVMIIISAIPTGLIGFLFSDLFESLFTKMIFVGIGLLITGTCLFIVERIGKGKKTVYGMRFRDAFFIGLCQAVAIAPGISRSGSTLVGGLLCKINRPLAVKFAFLMSIPPIAASGILELKNAMSQGMAGVSMIALILGVAISFVSGVIAIKWMINIVTKKSLVIFSFYTWAVGVLVIVLAAMGIL